MPAMIATQPVYSEALVKLGRSHERVVTVDADLMRSVGSESFARQFPERAFQVGIAEQNMVCFAAGLASCGKIPFTHTFGVFASRRICDQIAISVAFNIFNVKIVGAQAGLTAALNGATHESLEDVAIIRSIPNMTIVEPCDAQELLQMVQTVAEYDGPVYLRIPRFLPEKLGEDSSQLSLGTARVMRKGTDVAIVTAGVMVGFAMEAAETLAKEGISSLVLNASTLKPIDAEAVIEAARETGAVVTVENHSINGGLGGIVAELLVEQLPTPMVRVGTRDVFGGTGELSWLLESYGLTPAHIARAAKQAIDRKAK